MDEGWLYTGGWWNEKHVKDTHKENKTHDISDKEINITRQFDET